MSNKSLFTKEATTDVREMMRSIVSEKPGVMGNTRVDVEILRNHLMKCKIRLADVEFTIFADEPVPFGGEGAGTPPFGYFMAGAAMCECAQYIWNAVELGITDKISKLEMTLEGGFAVAALVGLNDAKGAATVPEMKITTRIEGDASPEEIDKLGRIVAWRCPAHQTIANKVRHLNIMELNGKKVSEFSEPYPDAQALKDALAK
jgi:uncharacterized OsmC-like protein